jgi:hypothetical protein
MSTAPRADFDSPWKEAVELLFPAFMHFFFPTIATAIDWSKGYEFLDKELEKIVRDATLGRRYADKLVKVFLHEGRETWLLIHLEIQGYYDAAFPQRMYVYHYRIFDRYGVEVISLAVLSDDDPTYRPAEYRTGRWGCQLVFQFPIVKVLDYGQNWAALEANSNPFAIVVMAHLQARAVPAGVERQHWKLRLVRLLYERGCERQAVLELFRFIDWLLVLPEPLEQAFLVDLRHFEEEQRMPYVSSAERLATQQGSLEGSRAMLLEAIATRFGAVSEDIIQAVNTIETVEALRALLRQAISSSDLTAFREALLTATC